MLRSLLQFALSVLTVAVGLGFVGGGSSALAASEVATEQVRASLITETERVRPGGTAWVALRFDIAPGWHTYWRNPGDSGEPTRIDWRLPDGVRAGDIQWPYPQAIPYGPLINFGYEGRVLHLVAITVPDTWQAGTPVPLVAEATWLVCAEICIPQSATLETTLTTEPSTRSDVGAVEDFAETRQRLPLPSPWPARFGADGENIRIAIDTGAVGANVIHAQFFPFEWGIVEPTIPPVFAFDDGRLSLTARRGERIADASVVEGVLVVTERSGGATLTRALELAAEPTLAGGLRGAATASSDRSSLAATTGAGTPGLTTMIAFAVLGGMILNLMPCVFPVLSMKAMGLIRHASASARQRRLSGLAYTAGVLSFMGLVAGLLIALRAGGEQLGWGFQLQSPVFVGVMAVVLFVLGLNLSGVFEIGAGIMGRGAGAASRSGTVGSFFTGSLAAMVATPCTAPFMGTAIGYALTRPWPIALAVMLALGFGLALPYLLLTLMPGLGRWLPRPGPWMERFKQLLAFPLYASAAWLVWVLSLQAGPDGVLATLAALVLVAFAVWLHRSIGGAEGAPGVVGKTAVAAIAVVALALVASLRAVEPSMPASGPTAAETAGLAAEPYSSRRLAELRDADRPVFVNITAAWCITCKLNERVALSSERVARLFREEGVIYLKGDWTNRDPEITRFLAAFGRSGVPLYLLYGAGDDQPHILPQLLTESMVVDAIDAAVSPATGPTTARREK
ncbi:MAG: thioredoxin family protein [Rhodospirillales bacterium]|nr:thioredoxin family protein [Rhodospirillales bacterium]